MSDIATNRGPSRIESVGSDADAVLTVSQIAAAGQVSVATARAWIRSGALRAFRTGGRRGGHFRVRAAELHRFFASMERQEAHS